jgi:hypothetical protein
MMTVLVRISEFEREIILECQREGIAKQFGIGADSAYRIPAERKLS